MQIIKNKSNDKPHSTEKPFHPRIPLNSNDLKQKNNSKKATIY